MVAPKIQLLLLVGIGELGRLLDQFRSNLHQHYYKYSQLSLQDITPSHDQKIIILGFIQPTGYQDEGCLKKRGICQVRIQALDNYYNMQHSKSKPIREYDALLLRCRYNKKYHLRLYALLFFYWLLSGINEAMFQLAIARKIKTQVFIGGQSIQIFMILLSIQLCFYLPRTKVNWSMVIALTIGSIIMAIGAKIQNRDVFVVGELIIEVLHYSLSLNIMMITIEYFPKMRFGLIWFQAIFALTIGKLIGLWIYQSQISDEDWSIYIVLPFSIIYLLTLIIVKESPRYWIDHNISKAEQLLRQIAQSNKVAYQPIQGLLQRQYFWHRIGLTKHNFLTVSKYKSISYNTYILCVCALLLGIICRCPDFIQHLREDSVFQVQDTVQIAWVSCFQICALIPSYLGSRTIKRKSITMGCSIVLVILTILLAILQLTDFYFGNAVVYSMVIFGLSSFFSMGYFYFIILSALQFFPHTVRTLGCGLIFCFYSLGRLLFSMHIEFIEQVQFLQRDSNMMQLVICCSLLLLIHSWLVRQTFQDEGRFDLAEIEEKQTEDY